MWAPLNEPESRGDAPPDCLWRSSIDIPFRWCLAFHNGEAGTLQREFTLATYLGADGMLHARPTRGRRAYRPSCVTLRGISSHPAAGHDGEHFAHEVKRRFAKDGWVFVPWTLFLALLAHWLSSQRHETLIVHANVMRNDSCKRHDYVCQSVQTPGLMCESCIAVADCNEP